MTNALLLENAMLITLAKRFIMHVYGLIHRDLKLWVDVFVPLINAQTVVTALVIKNKNISLAKRSSLLCITRPYEHVLNPACLAFFLRASIYFREDW